eukprot:m.165124 g.165124  ORF g.165124 m.165124 type:complete len:578 (-) comp17150_c1_seq1:1415-3148(-)
MAASGRPPLADFAMVTSTMTPSPSAHVARVAAAAGTALDVSDDGTSSKMDVEYNDDDEAGHLANAAAIAAAATYHPLTPIEPSARSRSESPGEQRLYDWLQTFRSWDDSQRKRALTDLVETLREAPVGHRHILHLNSLLRPYLQRDFLAMLPKELALHVLSFLDPKTLLTVSQVSRAWYDHARDNSLWRQRGSAKYLTLAQHQHLALHRPVAWKDAYMLRLRLDYAWRKGALPVRTELPGHDRYVTCLVVSEDGHVISGSDDSSLKVWALGRPEPVHNLVGHTGGVWCCAVEGDYIVSGATDRTLRVWSLATGACLHILSGHSSTVRCVRMLGRYVISGSRDQTVRMWDAHSGELKHIYQGHNESVRCVEYDGKLIVSCSYDFTIRVWDPNVSTLTSGSLRTLTGHVNRVYSLQFDGKIICSGALDMTIKVWDVHTGACLHTLRGHQSLTGLMLLRDNILVSGNADSTLRVWNVTNGACLANLGGHSSAITCLCLHDNFITSCSDDGSVKLWDITTGKLVRTLVDLAQGPPPVGQGWVVWRVQCTETHMICAAGRNGPENGGTKLIVLDFLQSAYKG